MPFQEAFRQKRSLVMLCYEVVSVMTYISVTEVFCVVLYISYFMGASDVVFVRIYCIVSVTEQACQ